MPVPVLASVLIPVEFGDPPVAGVLLSDDPQATMLRQRHRHRHSAKAMIFVLPFIFILLY